MKKTKKRHHQNGKDGFTLIETLLYISGFSVMIFGITSFMGIFTDARVRNQVIAEVEQQGANILYQISQTIRDSHSIETPAFGEQADQLVLYSPHKVTFHLNETVMEREDEAVFRLNASRVEISDLLFHNLSSSEAPGIVRGSFTLTHVNPSGRPQYDYSKTFYVTASLRPK